MTNPVGKPHVLALCTCTDFLHHCPICTFDKVICETCGCTEGELLPQCPGKPMTEFEKKFLKALSTGGVFIPGTIAPAPSSSPALDTLLTKYTQSVSDASKVFDYHPDAGKLLVRMRMDRKAIEHLFDVQQSVIDRERRKIAWLAEHHSQITCGEGTLYWYMYQGTQYSSMDTLLATHVK